MHPELDRLLNQLRREIRRSLGWELAGRSLTALGVAFWIGLLVDWSMEPSPELRQVAMVITVGAILCWLVVTTLRPLLRNLSDRQLALMIERQHPHFADALITAVDLRDANSNVAFDKSLLEATTQRAERLVQDTRESVSVDFSQPRRWLSVATLLAASVALFACANFDAMAIYARRLAMSPEPWPRRVMLSVEGFQRGDDGILRRKIAIGESLELVVKADLSGDHVAPDQVRLRYRFQDGPRGQEVFAKIGEPRPATDATGEPAHQVYRHTLEDVRTDVRLTISGGDGRLGPLEAVVAPRPAIVAAEYEVTPPAYLKQPNRFIAASAASEIPAGSIVKVHLQSSKPLARVDVAWRSSDAPAISGSLKRGAKEAQINTSAVMSSDALQVSLLDMDGIASLEPQPLPFEIVPDSPPRVDLQLIGVGAIVTPDADIATLATIEDDYAIRSAEIRVAIDGQAIASRPFVDSLRRRRSRVHNASVDLLTERFAEGLDAGRLKRGQEITLSASANDYCDLDDSNRTSVSQSYTLQVVTPDQLLASLEQREVNLRRTFEETVAEMHRTTRLLGSAFEDSGEPAGENPPIRRGRMRDSLAKIELETLSIGSAFAAIRDELVHNRIPNDELLERIGEGIARPLRELSEGDLRRLKKSIAAEAGGPDQLAAKRALANAIVTEMERVLKQMRSLENYNEVLALLRQIIDEQRRVQRDTEKTSREQVRRLLLD